MRKPFVYSWMPTAQRDDLILQSAYPEAVHEWARVIDMNRQREWFVEWVVPIIAMLVDQIASGLRLAHCGHCVAKKPPAFSLFFSGTLHFLENVKVVAPLPARGDAETEAKL